jgi:outer membrane protein, heavy metal efflux system
LKIRCITWRRQQALISLFLVGANVLAASVPLQPDGIPSAEIVHMLIAADPAVAVARADLAVAQQDANLLRRSPYEWNVSATQQRRRVDNGLSSAIRYREWNASIERSFRLPSKRKADFAIADATLAMAQANYQQTVRASKTALLRLWLDALNAKQAHVLAELALQSMQQSVDAVTKRLRTGDASRLELNLSLAELAEQRRLANASKTQARVSADELAARFPGLGPVAAEPSLPKKWDADLAYWHGRIAAESNVLKVAKAALKHAEARVDRASADEIPDPSIGVFRSSESDGLERITGFTISIPFPGGARATHRAKAIAERERAQQNLTLLKRELDIQIGTKLRLADAARQDALLAGENAQLTSDSAELTERAFTLGEADLSWLLQARRQANSAANTALMTKTAALMAYCQLLLDANLIWSSDDEQ